MNVVDLKPVIEVREQFSLRRIKFFPKQCGCYVLTNFHGTVLYIGKTKDIFARANQHLKSLKKTENTVEGKAYYIYFKMAASEADAFKLERGWLNIFELSEGRLPILNMVHSPVK